MLARAAQILGGPEALRRRLGVSQATLERWLEAKSQVPQSVFLQLCDLILDDDIGRAAQDRRHDWRPIGEKDDSDRPATAGSD
jgi:hypothetical protein